MFNSNFNRLYIYKNTKNLCFGSLLISSIISSTLPVKADASLEELKARLEKAQKENLLLKAAKIERENLIMKAEALEAENAALRNESKPSKKTSSTLTVQSLVVITSPTTQSKQAGNKKSATRLIDHSKSDHALNAALDAIPKDDERREMTAAYKPVSVDASPIVRQWQGIYAGINAGYGEGQASYSGNTAGPVQSYPCAGFAMCSNNLNYTYPTFYYFSGENNLSGPVAGGQIGYNHQFINHIIFGAEADLNYADINNRYANTGARKSTEVSRTQVYTYGNNDRTGINWIGTARLRLGYDLGKFLPYITGGMSYGSVSNNSSAFNQSITNWNNLQLSAAGSATNNSSINIGWAAGAGAEYIVADNWSIKGEYLFTQLGSLNVNGYPTALSTNNSMTGASTLNGVIGPWSIHNARVGLNYHTDWLANKPVVISKY